MITKAEERNYFERRAAEERAQADRALHIRARAAHLELARSYERRMLMNF
jgi:hypothetical protein